MRTTKRALGLLCAAALLGLPQAEAKPGGCLKYGAAGAVAGHYAGHHAMKGAILGCLAGMARRHEYNKEVAHEKEVAREKAAEANKKFTEPGATPAGNSPAQPAPADNSAPQPAPTTDQK